MSKTVSQTSGAEAQPVEQAAPEVQETKSKTLTNWRVFEEAGFVPVRVRCDGYKGEHPSDLSCHSNMPPTAENVIRHANPMHGGGWFRIKFRISDGKKSPLWRGLEEAGIELQDFHCPHCREQVPVSPRRIIYHLQNHPGANRVNLDPQVLCMTLGFQRMDQDEMEGLYE